MGLILFALAASAAPEKPPTAWDGTRWFIEIEETTPAPVELSAEDNFSFRTRALQLQAILHCPSANSFGKKLEVNCKIETISIRATPRSLDPAEALVPGNQRVLDNMVQRLERSKILFVVTPDGTVSTVDLPDLVANNRRESESREVLRRIAFDLVAGFSLDMPEGTKEGSVWTEKNSVLLRAPTQPALLGNTKTGHNLSTVDGVAVVQSTGQGLFTAPYLPWEFAYDARTGKPQSPGSSGGSSGGGGGGGPAPISQKTINAAPDARTRSDGPGASASTPSDLSFEGTLTAIAVLEPKTYAFQERVWAMLASPTASSIGNMQGTSIYYAGHIRRIEEMEAVSLANSEIVAPPGQSIDGIGIWVPITTF